VQAQHGESFFLPAGAGLPAVRNDPEPAPSVEAVGLELVMVDGEHRINSCTVRAALQYGSVIPFFT